MIFRSSDIFLYSIELEPSSIYFILHNKVKNIYVCIIKYIYKKPSVRAVRVKMGPYFDLKGQRFEPHQVPSVHPSWRDIGVLISLYRREVTFALWRKTKHMPIIIYKLRETNIKNLTNTTINSGSYNGFLTLDSS